MVADAFDRSWDSMVNDPNTPTLSTDYDAADIAELGMGVTEDNDMFLSDQSVHNAFDLAWDLMKMSDETRDALANFDRIAGSPLNIASLFSGLGDSDLSQHSPLGLAGFGTAAKLRGHNVQSFEIDPSLKQGNPNYHIDDILTGSVKDKVEELLEIFDGGPIDFITAGIPCKAFSIGGQNVAWKVDEDTIRHYWREVRGDKPLPIPTPKQMEKDPSLTPEMKASIRGEPGNSLSLGRPGIP